MQSFNCMVWPSAFLVKLEGNVSSRDRRWKWFTRGESVLSTAQMAAPTVLGVMTVITGWLGEVEPYWIWVGTVVVACMCLCAASSLSQAGWRMSFFDRDAHNAIVLDKPLLPPGWKLSESRGGSPLLETQSLDGRMHLRIMNAPELHSYAMDHEASIPASDCKTVQVILRDWNRAGTFHVYLLLANVDGRRLDRIATIDLTNPRSSHNGTERAFNIRPEKKDDGWWVLTIPTDVLASEFGACR